MHWTAPRHADAPAVVAVLRQLRGDRAEAVLEPFDRPPERIMPMGYQPTRVPDGVRVVRGTPDRWTPDRWRCVG